MHREVKAALRDELETLAAHGLKRSTEPLAPDAREFEFCSNDYLGLSNHPAILEASIHALQESGAGARASRLLGGGSTFDAQAEQAMARWVGAEAALLFPTGYQANLGLITTLAGRGDVLFCDALIHASSIDACQLSRAERRIFEHNDLEQLERQLATATGARRKLVLVESLFSMDGDAAPLLELNEVCERNGAWLIVDEAHALGVCGPHGAGLVAALEEELGGPSQVLARVMTGGKALGCGGGFVVGSSELRDLLVHRARSFVFTTGIAPCLAAGLSVAIQVAQEADEDRATLRQRVGQLALALDLPEPAGPILPFVVGSNERSSELSTRLRGIGLEVRAVRPPTVPEGTARLRVALHSFNTEEAVSALSKNLAGEAVKYQPSQRQQALRPIVVIGTDTDIGKTVVSAALALAHSKRGKTTYWKPVQTGNDSDTFTVEQLASGESLALLKPAYEFPLPASPHEAAAAAGTRIDFEVLLERFEEERARESNGQLIIELAGGLLVPLNDEVTQADFLVRVQVRCVLVARAGLGTLNHTLLTLEALRARRIRVETLVLVGEPHASNRATLEARSDVTQILELPRLPMLGREALEEWVRANPSILS